MLSKKGNEGFTEVADRVREFTMNLDTLEEGYGTYCRFFGLYLVHLLALALNFSLIKIKR